MLTLQRCAKSFRASVTDVRVREREMGKERRGSRERERDDVGGDPEKEGPPRYDCNPFAYIDGDSWYHSSNDLSHPSGNATRLPTRAFGRGFSGADKPHLFGLLFFA